MTELIDQEEVKTIFLKKLKYKIEENSLVLFAHESNKNALD